MSDDLWSERRAPSSPRDHLSVVPPLAAGSHVPGQRAPRDAFDAYAEVHLLGREIAAAR